MHSSSSLLSTTKLFMYCIMYHGMYNIKLTVLFLSNSHLGECLQGNLQRCSAVTSVLHCCI